MTYPFIFLICKPNKFSHLKVVSNKVRNSAEEIWGFQTLQGFPNNFSSAFAYYNYFYPSEMLPFNWPSLKGNFYKIFQGWSYNICILAIAGHDKILALTSV